MALLDGIEKLINEHGSATILRERIALANDKHAMLEEKIQDLESRNELLSQKLETAESELATLKSAAIQLQNTNPDGYVCDDSGSPNLRRAGSRPDPTFGVLGVKQQVFLCEACGEESAFTPEQ